MHKLRRLCEKLIDLFFIFIKSSTGYARYKGVQVGENCRILIKEFGTEPWLITVGDNVTITNGVKLLTHDGSTWLMKDEAGRRYLYRRIKIGNNVFIGANSIILPGVIIDDDVIVAAGSVVTKSVPSGYMVAGNPARKVRDFDEYKSFVLKNYVPDKGLDIRKSYFERINEVLDNTYKKYMD